MANSLPIPVGELIEAPTINTWARGYLRKTTAKTVAGTVSATDLFNGEFTLPADGLGTDKIARVTAWGDWMQHASLSAPQDIPEFVVWLGGSVLIDTGGTGGTVAASSTTRYGWRIVCEIQNLGAANAQWVTFHGVITCSPNSANASPFSQGEGLTVMSSNGRGAYDGSYAAAVDTTAACALLLDVQNASGDAGYETKLYGALVEII